MYELLTRDEFRTRVFARSKKRCVFCGGEAVDAHHIMDRKLYPNGGYYLENGAAVCEHHHWQCEMTLIPVERVWVACSINDPALPPGFDPSKMYDKWGNEIINAHHRLPGPLANDDGCRKALTAGKLIYQLY